MKLFENSILELIAKPLAPVSGNVKQVHIYEHVFTPLVVASFVSPLPSLYRWIIFGTTVLVHLVIKELLYDRIVHKEFNIPNIIERIYGCALWFIVLKF